MGANLELFGINYEKLVEDYPGYFKNNQVSVEELTHLYYESLYDKIHDGKNCGLKTFFENRIRRYCSTINEMMYYFIISFDWKNEINDMEVEHFEDNYIFTKSQVLGLIDWYIALTFVFSNDKELISKIKELKYLIEAKGMINHFKSFYSDQENYFEIYGYDFVTLKEEVLNAPYDSYFYTYSS